MPPARLPESQGGPAAAAPAGSPIVAPLSLSSVADWSSGAGRGLSCDIFDARHAVTRNAEAERTLRHMRYARPNPPQITS